jgi:hypothetical protein
MYLLYDRLQLGSSSLGHTLLVKRQNWKSTSDDIAFLTVDQLEDAARAVVQDRIIDSPTIQRLQRNIVTIGTQVPESFSQKLRRRSEIRGLIARHGMPTYYTHNYNFVQVNLWWLRSYVRATTHSAPC